MHRRFLAAAVCACAAIACPPAEAAGGARFSLEPVGAAATRGYFVLDGRGGRVLAGSVRVSNTGTAPGTLLLYPADASTGQTSGVVYLPRDRALHADGRWLKLDRQRIRLAPGQSRIVPFAVGVPERARPGEHVAGIAAENTELAEAAGNRASALRIRVRSVAVVAVQVNLPGRRAASLRITRVTVGGHSGYQQLLVSLRNDGTELVAPVLRIRVTDANGRVVQDRRQQLLNLLPLTSIDYPFVVQGKPLGVGRYEALVEGRYARDRVVRYRTSFEVSDRQLERALTIPPQVVHSAVGDSAFPVGLLGGVVAAAAALVAAVAIRRRIVPAGAASTGALATGLPTTPPTRRRIRRRPRRGARRGLAPMFVKRGGQRAPVDASGDARNQAPAPWLDLERPGVVWFAGKALPLERRDGARSVASLEGDRLVLRGARKDAPAALERWYRREARRRVAAVVARQATRLGVVPPSVTVSGDGSRCSSSAARATLSCSWRLLLAPEDVLEFVVLKELARRCEPPCTDIESLLDTALPTWQRAALWLSEHGRALSEYRLESALPDAPAEK